MSLSDFSENKILDHSSGKAAWTMPTASIGLFTAAPTDAGGGTEVAGGSYARKTTAAADWNSASSGQQTNAQALAFPTATADWAPSGTPLVAYGSFDASSGGNLIEWDYLGNHPYKPIVGDDTAGDTIRCPAHGYVADDRVVFTAEFGGTLPTGITAATLYWVIAGGLTTDAFKVSTTQGGAAVDITAVGSGMVRKVTTKVVQTGDTPSFAAGAFVRNAF